MFYFVYYRLMKVSYYAKTLENTLFQIDRLINAYWSDMSDLKGLTIQELFYYLARDIAYVKDPPGKELLMRPRILRAGNGGDCDDKTIAAVSWFIAKKIPAGYSIVSESADVPYHHIFAFYLTGKTVNDFDCTYPTAVFGSRREWTQRKNFIIYAG